MRKFMVRMRGHHAMFTPPFAKADPWSYPVLPPGAAQGIIRALYWKPAFQIEVERIEVLTPILHDTHQVKGVEGWTPKLASEPMLQTRSPLARVDYIVHFHLRLNPLLATRGLASYEDEMADKLAKGRDFRVPMFGSSEYPISEWELLTDRADAPPALDLSVDLGPMLCFQAITSLGTPEKPTDPEVSPVYWNAHLEHGVMDVPQVLWDRAFTPWSEAVARRWPDKGDWRPAQAAKMSAGLDSFDTVRAARQAEGYRVPPLDLHARPVTYNPMVALTLLGALADLPPDFRRAKVPWVWRLNPDGTTVAWEEQPKGMDLVLPDVPKGSGIDPNTLFDTLKYLRGVPSLVDASGKARDEDKARKRAADQHAAYRRVLEQYVAERKDGPAMMTVKAVLKALDRNDPVPEEVSADVYALPVVASAGAWWEDEALRAFHTRRLVKAPVYGQCSICLQEGVPLAKLHPQSKRMGGGIVTFNKDSMTSYGREQGFNCPVCTTCAPLPARALDMLATREYGRSMGRDQPAVYLWGRHGDAQWERIEKAMDPTLGSDERASLLAPLRGWRGYVLSLGQLKLRIAIRQFRPVKGEEIIERVNAWVTAFRPLTSKAPAASPLYIGAIDLSGLHKNDAGTSRTYEELALWVCGFPISPRRAVYIRHRVERAGFITKAQAEDGQNGMLATEDRFNWKDAWLRAAMALFAAHGGLPETAQVLRESFCYPYLNDPFAQENDVIDTDNPVTALSAPAPEEAQMTRNQAMLFMLGRLFYRVDRLHARTSKTTIFDTHGQSASAYPDRTFQMLVEHHAAHYQDRTGRTRPDGIANKIAERLTLDYLGGFPSVTTAAERAAFTRGFVYQRALTNRFYEALRAKGVQAAEGEICEAPAEAQVAK